MGKENFWNPRYNVLVGVGHCKKHFNAFQNHYTRLKKEAKKNEKKSHQDFDGPNLQSKKNQNHAARSVGPRQTFTSARVFSGPNQQSKNPGPSKYPTTHPYTRNRFNVVFRFPVFSAASMLLAKKRGPPRKTTGLF